ncbi:cytidylyltransferase domain-containing protein [Brucella sp. IR073]|uniref:acylneuraminate cytidylyltransferase family protein n=1 Tax=unclassified Brucella TaxID=2632610 RepID=UPI003B97D0F5
MTKTDMNCVALITARGGSKRLPRKNVLPLAGRPLISWSIKAALEAKHVRRVIVSTDDQEIAEVSRSAGAEVPFMRPTELAGDRSSHYGVVEHAINWIEEDESRLPDVVLLLQPTSPLRTAEDIDGLLDRMKDERADSAFTVSPARDHPAYLFRLDEQQRASPFMPIPAGYMRSQDMEPLYRVNGAGYALRPETFRQRDKVLGDRPVAYIMPEERSIDIDNELDFLIAAVLLERFGGGRT